MLIVSGAVFVTLSTFIFHSHWKGWGPIAKLLSFNCCPSTGPQTLLFANISVPVTGIKKNQNQKAVFGDQLNVLWGTKKLLIGGEEK